MLGIEPNFRSKSRKALAHSVISPSQDGPDPSGRLAQVHLVNEKSQGSEGLGDFQKTCPETQRTPENLGTALQSSPAWGGRERYCVRAVPCPHSFGCQAPTKSKGRCRGHPPCASKGEEVTDHQGLRASSPGTQASPFSAWASLLLPGTADCCLPSFRRFCSIPKLTSHWMPRARGLLGLPRAGAEPANAAGALRADSPLHLKDAAQLNGERSHHLFHP